jgi:hypothetical protein
MFDLMQASSDGLEEKYTEEQALEMSAAVVTGYIDSVTEGRVVDIPQARATFTYNTALFKVEVTEVLKGNVGKYVYFEYIRGGMPAEAYDAVKYTGELKFYLREINWYDPTKAVVKNSTKGLMKEVDHLYTLFSEDMFFGTYTEKDAPRGPFPTIPLPTDAPRDSNGNIYLDPPLVPKGRINSEGVAVPSTEGEQ